jgi:hypothetical protein
MEWSKKKFPRLKIKSLKDIICVSCANLDISVLIILALEVQMQYIILNM